MKVGDKVYCYYRDKHQRKRITVGKFYIISNITYHNRSQRYGSCKYIDIITDTGDCIGYPFDKIYDLEDDKHVAYFHKFFKPLKELRKNKLQKINESRR